MNLINKPEQLKNIKYNLRDLDLLNPSELLVARIMITLIEARGEPLKAKELASHENIFPNGGGYCVSYMYRLLRPLRLMGWIKSGKSGYRWIVEDDY
jgi:hypothetical protein